MAEHIRLPVEIGETIADTYLIEGEIGRGAMGVVLAARHVRLDQRRAIKFMNPAYADDEISLTRFVNEARGAARLSSEHAATIHDLGFLGNGIPFIVMEYLIGVDLQKVMDARKGQPTDIGAAALYVQQASSALREAHAVGMIHRDLKPANLFVTRRTNGDECIKVLDFGLSKLIKITVERADLTNTGDIMGTPYYMSPEQMTSTRDVDHRTDIWSLGVVLYELVTGQRPFGGHSGPVIFASVLEKTPTLPRKIVPDIHPHLEETIMACLEKAPSRRLGTVQELMERLDPFVPLPAPISVLAPTVALSAQTSYDGPSADGSASRSIASDTVRDASLEGMLVAEGGLGTSGTMVSALTVSRSKQ